MKAKKSLSLKEMLALPLYEQAIEREHERHRARLKEIEHMRAALKMLDAERTAIKAAGREIYAEHISRSTFCSTLVYSPMFDHGPALLAALLRNSWKVTERGMGAYPSPTLKKGRLQLRISGVYADALEKAEELAFPDRPGNGVSL
ncbi:hypothetical protein B7R77_17990 [Ralstonia solanacearum K60]|uniref:Uncharacterized protein n=1 Tax=Ralstonia solanacearum K60 TaxID=1091042 RepID=A0AAP7ZQK0_RALSL|nr:hypothetical protein [Ralstonia solanacearum]OYQ14904.1 hypothetical protein B7R77_17715 [Ralstonia solanacearum K60]OYQ14951.1 hypothetical protein B7R77_17990 [Ralstonia solanacearum K60]CCF97584.1 conserved hypothetical protein [Ralstonia solanacearum K60]